MASNECECTCANVISFGAERITPLHTQRIIKKYSCGKQIVRENTNLSFCESVVHLECESIRMLFMETSCTIKYNKRF